MHWSGRTTAVEDGFEQVVQLLDVARLAQQQAVDRQQWQSQRGRGQLFPSLGRGALDSGEPYQVDHFGQAAEAGDQRDHALRPTVEGLVVRDERGVHHDLPSTQVCALFEFAGESEESVVGLDGERCEVLPRLSCRYLEFFGCCVKVRASISLCGLF